MTRSPSFALLVTLAAALAVPASAQADDRPNIIYVMSDDHALRTIGAYSDFHSTPNLDRISDQGAVFENAFVGNSICGPSRAAILTGTHGHVNGITGNGEPWDSTQAVFPRLLQQAGYQTALFGKWHLNSRPADEYDEYTILTGAGKQGFYYNPEVYSPDTGTRTIPGYSTDIVTDLAIDWLDRRNQDEPFLLLVQYKAVHVPRMPPLRLLDRYLEDVIPEPPTLYDDLATRTHNASAVNFLLTDYRPLRHYGRYDPQRDIYLARMTDQERRAYHAVVDPQNEDYWRMRANGAYDDPRAMRAYHYQRFIKDYLRIVDALDENVGRLLDRIDADPALENTIVVYASDQGYFTGEHGYAEKRLMYEEAVRMPLLMRWPERIAPGTRIDALVQNIDLAPTFLEVAGLAPLDRMQGVPLAPVLRGETPQDWRRSIYYHYYDHGRHQVARHAGVRTQTHKLIHFYTDDTWELYDLEADPMELRNVYGTPGAATVQAALEAEYLRLRDVYGVPPETFEAPFL
ncbi:sulfatase family protein [Rubrivirga sp.]|uniref:sulfatase family protein n=1 Tax=Rubrivirga sp. TaxID=1885344 RepID=UPI003C77DCCB